MNPSPVSHSTAPRRVGRPRTVRQVTAPATTAPDAWLSAKEAVDLLNVSRKTLARLGDERKLTRRCVPGGIPRYLRSDVERLVKQSTTVSVEGNENGNAA